MLRNYQTVSLGSPVNKPAPLRPSTEVAIRREGGRRPGLFYCVGPRDRSRRWSEVVVRVPIAKHDDPLVNLLKGIQNVALQVLEQEFESVLVAEVV